MTMPSEAAVLWGGEKFALATELGVADDGLHVIVGVGVLLLLALVTGRRMDDPWLWLTVLIVECANEVIDMTAAGGPEANWPASRHDLVLTMLLPTALLLLLRFTGWRTRQAAASTEAASEANSARPSVDE